MSPMTRRQFLQVGAASLGAATFGGGLWTVVAGAAPKGGGGGGGGTVKRYPLRIPPVVGSGVSLVAAPEQLDVGGRTTWARLYNGQFPGPSIVVDKGDAFVADLTNGLDMHTMIHWHGLVVPTAVDGQPKEAVEVGDSYRYAFTVNQRASLNFYHPHPHGHTASQVYHGLAGAFIIRDSEEAFLAGLIPDYEIPLVIRDASFDSAGNLVYGGKASGFLGKEPMVNGTLAPFRTVTPSIYRLRIVNAATARIFRLSLAPAIAWTLIGNDGGFLPAPVPLGPTDTIDVSPGERLDVLVDFRGLAAGSKVTLRCNLAGWTLVEFQVDGTFSGIVPTFPTPWPTHEVLPPVPAADDHRRRRISFDGMTRINGKVFDQEQSLFTVPHGVVEEWTFTTNGNAPHPVHVHGTPFQVIDRTGGRNRLFPWEDGWKDTVLLNDGESVTVRICFDKDVQRGQRYLIHCHKLEHEDAGMMARFDVS